MRAQLAGAAPARRRPGHVRPGDDHARRHDDLPLRDPALDRGVRQLPGAAHDRGPRHGLPAHERAQLLALPRIGPAHVRRARARDGAGRGLVRLRPAGVTALRPGARHRLLRARADPERRLVDRRRRQLPGDDRQASRSRDVAEPDAALLLRDPGDVVLAGVRPSRAHDRPRVPRSSTASSGSGSSTSPTAAIRCSGSTSSGSSGIPRSTSSCCRRSGSRRRSSRRSRAG